MIFVHLEVEAVRVGKKVPWAIELESAGIIGGGMFGSGACLETLKG